jgi:hypothetical protein
MMEEVSAFHGEVGPVVEVGIGRNLATSLGWSNAPMSPPAKGLRGLKGLKPLFSFMHDWPLFVEFELFSAVSLDPYFPYIFPSQSFIPNPSHGIPFLRLNFPLT